jgi:acetyltransferase-like isoleucine patch superfamily enzyme
LKAVFKALLNVIFLALAFPAAALSGFGRVRGVFRFFAQSFAMAPGLPGDYLRIAFYRMTLDACSHESRIQFGSFFAHPEARVGRGVYIGIYCVLGQVEIGDRTQIASAVQILSGKHQHSRNAEGTIQGSERGIFTTMKIGADCWLGAGAIVMAHVGEGSTIGAGSVVTTEIPPHSVAVGNPARVIREASAAAR